MQLFDFPVRELWITTFLLSERGERAGSFFMAVFLQSLLIGYTYQWASTRKTWKDVGGMVGRFV